MVRTGRCNRYRSYIIDEIRAGYNTNASALRVQNLGQGGALGLGQLGPGGAAQKKIAAVQPETIGPGPAQGGYHVRQVMAGLPLVLRMVVIAAVAVPDAVGPKAKVQGNPLGPGQGQPFGGDVFKGEAGAA